MAGSTTTAKTLFDFLPIDGVANEAALKDWISMMREDTTFFLLTVKAGTPRQAVGFFSLMRATPKAGSIETGWVTFSPALQRTRAATEAFYLLLRYTFNELGYRRHEWKCDAANLPSRRAAQRLGFSWEGLFRNAAVVKGLNRDTAWFAMTCEDWLTLEAKAFQPFLSAENFDSHGLQRVGLSALTAPLLHATDPLQDHQRAQLALGQQA
ncbi:unnamed protein product [Polarella glacialis]|nr:unnamed protein product [Polarella glacialis]